VEASAVGLEGLTVLARKVAWFFLSLSALSLANLSIRIEADAFNLLPPFDNESNHINPNTSMSAVMEHPMKIWIGKVYCSTPPSL
jgi:hypothetical protein